jgi:hypothetical protein
MRHFRITCTYSMATGRCNRRIQTQASDSDGKGIWVKDGDRIKGKWVEVIADRITHKFTGRAEISYETKVSGVTFVGTDTARSYDANGTLTDGPTAPGPFEGKRVTLP